jgi:hypothetical protein
LKLMAATRRATGVANLIGSAAGALLCLAVAYIHVKDQGGIIGAKDPSYMQAGYYALEITAVVAAAMLVARVRPLVSWFLAVGVAAGPLVGFVLSRTVGLPNAMDDRGNWTETLALVSVVVEGALLILATVAFFRARSHPATDPYAAPAGARSFRHDEPAVSAAR